MSSAADDVDPQAAAASVATTQAANWLQRHYGDELSGKQMRHIATNLGAIYEPYIKVALVASMAEDMRLTLPEIAAAMDQVAAAALDDFRREDDRAR